MTALRELVPHVKWLRKAAEEIRSEGRAGWGNTCEAAADAVQSVIDAEGDGGAVGGAPKLFSGDLDVLASLGFPKTAERIRAVLAAQPVRSGVVSEEQLSALAVIYGSGYRHGHESTVEGWYTDVVHYDRATYWLDTVREMVEEDDDLRTAINQGASNV